MKIIAIFALLTNSFLYSFEIEYVPPIDYAIFTSPISLVSLTYEPKIQALGTDGQLYYLNGLSFKPEKRISKNILTTLRVNDDLIIASEDGLKIKDKIYKINSPKYLFEKEGNVYIITTDSILIFDKDIYKIFDFKEFYGHCICKDNLYILTETGLYEVEKDNIKYVWRENISNGCISCSSNGFAIKKDENVVIFLKNSNVIEIKHNSEIIFTKIWQDNVLITKESYNEKAEIQSIIEKYNWNGKLNETIVLDYQIRDIYPIDNKLFVLNEEGGGDLFYWDFNKRYNLPFPLNKIKLKILEVKDTYLSFYGESIWKGIQKWQGGGFIFFMDDYQKKAIDKNLGYLTTAMIFKNYQLALDAVESSIFMANYLKPELIQNLVEKRKTIIKRMNFFKLIKNGMWYLLYILILIVAIITSVKITRSKMKKMWRIPPDDVLRKLSGANFSHSLIYELNTILNNEEPIKEFLELKERIKKNLNYFENVIGNYKKYSPYWQNSIKEVKRSLEKLIHSKNINLIERCKKASNAVENLSKSIKSMRGNIITDALTKAVSRAQKIAEHKNVDIKIQVERGEGEFVRFYPQELKEFEDSFYSIIQNAIESFADDNSSNNAFVLITSKEDMDNVYISIKDNGKGIPADIVEKIFEDGFSYDKGNGRGYGLTGVKNLFKKWGTIEVLSEPGKGTEFKIILRRSKNENMDNR